MQNKVLPGLTLGCWWCEEGFHHSVSRSGGSHGEVI